MQIEINEQDYNFLKDLQRELNTQETDGNAQPVFWGILEEDEEARPIECASDYLIASSDGYWRLEEANNVINNHLEESDDVESVTKHIWNLIDHNDIEDVAEFMRDHLRWRDCRVVGVEKVYRLSEYTGAFLTKRAAKEYIERFGYNHKKPKTYAMTAVRNFELERLLNILRTINLK